MIWKDIIPPPIADLYEIQDYKHGAVILAYEFPDQFRYICQALEAFRFTEEEVKQPGGNESPIPKKFSQLLKPFGWAENILTATMVVDGKKIRQSTHKVDYIKGRVACDLEWNRKDQTYDRDLYAFRTFFDYYRISIGVIITRSNELDPWFKSL